MEAIAKWDFGGNGKDFLSFKEGDLIKLTALDVIIGDSKWYRAYLNGVHGFVGSSMLDIKPYQWFWGGSMNKEEAEFVLKSSSWRKLIIREASATEFIFFLSYKFKEDEIKHFKIYSNPDITFHFFSDFNGPKTFNTLNDLADYVKVHGWYSACWWNLYFDEQENIERQARKSIIWDRNTDTDE